MRRPGSAAAEGSGSIPIGKKRVRRPIGELALVEHIRQRARRAQPAKGAAQLRLGIGDDCAILRPGSGREIVVTTDFSLEGRHFRRDWHSPASIGHRALARGLSDLAAMGARPLAAFLSLALPREVAADPAWVGGFLDGLLSLARQVDVPLAGGDTAEAPGQEILADIVLLGTVPRGRALRRDGARPGDRLYVTGSLGGAAAELDALKEGTLQGEARASGHHPQLFPAPRLRAGQMLLSRGIAAAALDISDGLSTDLDHLCRSSGVCAEVSEARLPLHPLLQGRTHAEATRLALHGGEDYELLFTARANTRVPARIGGAKVTEIGQILPCRPGRPRVVLLDPDGRRAALAPGGWEHLR